MLMGINGGLDPSPPLIILKNKTVTSSTMDPGVINSATSLLCHNCNYKAWDFPLDYGRRGVWFSSLAMNIELVGDGQRHDYVIIIPCFLVTPTWTCAFLSYNLKTHSPSFGVWWSVLLDPCAQPALAWTGNSGSHSCYFSCFLGFCPDTATAGFVSVLLGYLPWFPLQ